MDTQETVHEDLQLFKCEQCDQSFKKSGALVSHMRLHAEEKHFKCAQCKYSSNHGGTLKKHMLNAHAQWREAFQV